MSLDRLLPVTFIAGASSPLAAACLRHLAPRSPGGVILADADEAALTALADMLYAENIAPERVSSMRCDSGDPEGWWRQAQAFMLSQYGRLDWAVAASGGDFDLPALAAPVRVAAALMRENAQGGAIVLALPASALAAELARSNGGGSVLAAVRALANQTGLAGVRLNALAVGAWDGPHWTRAAWFHDLVREHGGERAALAAVSQLDLPVARYAGGDGVARFLDLLLAEDAGCAGVTLAVDAGASI